MATAPEACLCAERGGEACVLPLWVRGGTFQHHGCHGGPGVLPGGRQECHSFYPCSPEIEAPYTSEEEQERLLGLYQYLHSRAHNASRPLKTIYYTGPNENLLAWVTGAFELYMCYSPLGTKASAVSAIHKLMRWIRKEEDRLFILTPLTY